MHKYNNLPSDQLIEIIEKLVDAHNHKKDEIISLYKLSDKKTEELTQIESEYALAILELNSRKNVIR